MINRHCFVKTVVLDWTASVNPLAQRMRNVTLLGCVRKVLLAEEEAGLGIVKLKVNLEVCHRWRAVMFVRILHRRQSRRNKTNLKGPTKKLLLWKGRTIKPLVFLRVVLAVCNSEMQPCVECDAGQFQEARRTVDAHVQKCVY